MYDYLVVGSGLYGATFAHEAHQHGKSVLVIDKRPNIAGNIYTEKVEGINFHKYGAHIFHTNNKTVWDYLQNFTVFNRFTNSPVANYNAAVKIKGILVSVVTSLGTVLLPRASYYVEYGMKEAFQRITNKAITFVFLIAAPLMVYFMLFAKEGIFFLSGEAYEGSILPMQIIMPTLFFIGLSNIMGIQILVPLGREKVVLYSEIAGAVVDLIINWILIPSMASAGVAIGTLVAEAVVTIWQYVALKDTVSDAYKQVHYIPIILGIALGSLASFWTKTLGWHEFFTMAVSAVIFFAVYGVVLLVAKEPLTIEIFNQVISKVMKKRKTN